MPESYLGQVLRNLVNIGAKGAENVQSLLNLPSYAINLLGKELIPEASQTGVFTNQPGITEQLSPLLPEKYFEPRSGAEELIQNIGSQAPLSYLTGGLGGIGSNIAGNLAAQGAKSAGASPLGQAGIQLGTEILSGGLQAAKGFKLPKTPKSVEKAAYQIAKELPEKALTPAGKLESGLKNVEKILRTETDNKIIGAVNAAKNRIGNLISYTPQGQQVINPIEAFEARKNLYKQLKDLPDKYEKYFHPIANAINDTLSEAAEQYPRQIGNLKLADKIHGLRNTPLKISKWVDKNITQGKLTPKSVAATSALLNNIGQLLWHPIKSWKITREVPQVWDTYKSLNKAVTKGVSLNSVNNIAKKLDKQLKESGAYDMDDSIDLDTLFA